MYMVQITMANFMDIETIDLANILAMQTRGSHIRFLEK